MIPGVDMISRTALIGVYDDAQPTIEAALDAHARTGLLIVADPASCASVAGQAALCTAVATAARAFGTVILVADPHAVLTVGPHQGRTVGQFVAAQGVRVEAVAGYLPLSWPTLLLGDGPTPARAGRVVLRATWSGWTAQVGPATAAGGECGGNVLAAIAAGALGVHEAFLAVWGRPGCDAGHRLVRLNLWAPGSSDDGPPLTYAPAGWWLVGLGHLGQANAWVVSWLGYENPGDVSIVLCDVDRAVPANHSTGILTPVDPALVRKTRLVAGFLDRMGFDTSLVERRLDPTTCTTDGDFHVALIGVDNLPARRLISGVGWPLAIDVGLGAGPGDFNAILLRRFPADRASDRIPGWADPTPTPPTTPTMPGTPAFADLGRRDPCGVVQVAGTAVGAAFVGVTAACLAVAEAIRVVLGGAGHDTLSLHLQTLDLDHAPATTGPWIVPAPLRAA